MENQSDEELLYLWRCGSYEAQEALVLSYYKYVYGWSKLYIQLNRDLDQEDLVQIGMLCFFNAVQNYRDDRKASLRTYIKYSVINRLHSAVSRDKSEENIIDYQMISLDSSINDDHGYRYDEVIEDKKETYKPDRRIIIKETASQYITQFENNASSIEKQVIRYKYLGLSEQEIANKLGMSVKSVYNAVYRARKKRSTIDVVK